jgi:sigma-B regulation protein RsbU (phosphoserine phosphatase)
MSRTYRYLRLRLSEAGLLPGSKLAFITWYLLGLDVVLFALQTILGFAKQPYGRSLGGWVGFLSFVVSVLFAYLAARWAKDKMLWRLRNRLIVTYVFVGVIPVVLLVALSVGCFYLFAGQFATFVVTSRLNSKLASLDAANSAIAHEIAARMRSGAGPEIGGLESLRQSEKAWAGRHVHVWLNGKLALTNSPRGTADFPTTCPSFLKSNFDENVRENGTLFLRSAKTIAVPGGKLVVVSSEPLNQQLSEELASGLGEITLYASGIKLHSVDQPASVPARSSISPDSHGAAPADHRDAGKLVLDTGKGPIPTFTVGAVPAAANFLDRQVTFPTSLRIVDWVTGDTSDPAAISVQTRVSKLYDHLFGAIGDFAPAVEISLLVVFVGFGIIEIVALYISTRLTRSVTGAVAQLYHATTHINRGDFRHRIPVRSTDQLSTLANSFNSMTTSLEELIEEQKQKQRLENELVIAQEVQEQLYPRTISQLATLEVHGFCRPARTVSGDYYDFVSVSPGKLLLAVGDISGKGISAALLMATIHSAVRAYSLEQLPVQQAALVVGGVGARTRDRQRDANVCPGTLLSLLNHQLYESTPMEKYATLFLGLYEEEHQKLTYSNGGHLPPIILGKEGVPRRLDRGGTVVGLFDHCLYEESSVQLRRGEIFLAYSDGVTEPENDFGEFGEQRLIDLVQENRDLSLAHITEIVTAAVDDWIGANEQPDDVTLVLARAR